jgi:lysozyme
MAEQLERGSEGPEVADLQEKLIELRFKPGEVDGVFGVLTESAVKMFQVYVKLEADGIVGERTFEALDSVIEQQKEAPAG